MYNAHEYESGSSWERVLYIVNAEKCDLSTRKISSDAFCASFLSIVSTVCYLFAAAPSEVRWVSELERHRKAVKLNKTR